MQVVEDTRSNTTSLLQPNEYFRARLNRYGKKDVIEELQNTLTAKQKAIFKGTPFKHFLDFECDKMAWAPQVVHQLMLRQLDQSNGEELVFSIGGMELKFGRVECSLITGLDCRPCVHHPTVRNENRLWNKYFPGERSITPQMLVNQFRTCQDDTDRVKLGIVYLLEDLLLSKDKTNVDASLMKVVDDMDTIQSYPWGDRIFRHLMNFFYSGFRDKVQKVKNKSMGVQQGKGETYQVGGFVFALQIWAYECIPTLSPVYGVRVKSIMPRMLNWHVKEVGQHALLESSVFESELVSNLLLFLFFF